MALIDYLIYGVGICTLSYLLWITYSEISLMRYMRNAPHYTVIEEDDILMED
jgi:hypothetical protein